MISRKKILLLSCVFFSACSAADHECKKKESGSDEPSAYASTTTELPKYAERIMDLDKWERELIEKENLLKEATLTSHQLQKAAQSYIAVIQHKPEVLEALLTEMNPDAMLRFLPRYVILAAGQTDKTPRTLSCLGVGHAATAVQNLSQAIVQNSGELTESSIPLALAATRNLSDALLTSDNTLSSDDVANTCQAISNMTTNLVHKSAQLTSNDVPFVGGAQAALAEKLREYNIKNQSKYKKTKKKSKSHKG
jgi:hypothetical protein